MSEHRAIELEQGRIARLRFHRPGGAYPVDPRTFMAISQAVDELTELRLNEKARPLVLVISGIEEDQARQAYGESAGISALSGIDSERGRQWSLLGQKAFSAIAGFYAPTLVAIEGMAATGGVELALACDVAIASDDAVFAMPEVAHGMVPAFGGTQRLPARIGHQAAMRLALLGERIDAHEALRLGLVAEVVPKAQLNQRLEHLAAHLASLSPEALFACKRLIIDSERLSSEAALASERGAFAALVSSSAARQAIEQFSGRRKSTR